MQTWIDQDLCTGCGFCEETAPAVYTVTAAGVAYVKEGARVLDDPGGPDCLADVTEALTDAVIKAAEECPGECIFLEVS